MAESNSDVLMRMVGPNGPIPAESQTVFGAGEAPDQLRSDFQPGHFCELLSFEFALGTEPVSKASGELTREDVLKLTQQAAEKAKSEQGANRSARAQAIDAQPVQFTRILDRASPRLFKALVECETLDQVSIVKRKAANTANSGEVYLRLDFTKVLVTELEWEDKEHYVEETGSFIYRQLMVRYRQQKPDGTLGVSIPMEWKMQR